MQTLALSVGLWGQGILGFWVLGAWSGMWAMDPGVPESLAVQTAYPVAWGCSRRRARTGPLKYPCQGPRAILGFSALVLFFFLF